MSNGRPCPTMKITGIELTAMERKIVHKHLLSWVDIEKEGSKGVEDIMSTYFPPIGSKALKKKMYHYTQHSPQELELVVLMMAEDMETYYPPEEGSHDEVTTDRIIGLLISTMTHCHTQFIRLHRHTPTEKNVYLIHAKSGTFIASGDNWNSIKHAHFVNQPSVKQVRMDGDGFPVKFKDHFIAMVRKYPWRLIELDGALGVRKTTDSAPSKIPPLYCDRRIHLSSDILDECMDSNIVKQKNKPFWRR